jgi:MFS superfamily sulfate permease-like transporter
MPNMNRLAFLKNDIPASLVVFLVALPLCMAIAVASGLPASAGLITGIVGGLVVGWIAGSPLQVSGPAAGLIVLVAGVVATYDGVPGLSGAGMLAVILLLAGIMQVAAGLLRLASWFRAVAPSVIQGMLAGIGANILVGQFHALFDLKPLSGGLANLQAIPESIQSLLLGTNGANALAALLGVFTIAILVAWEIFLKKKTILPAALAAIIAASVVAFALGWQVRFVDVPSGLAGVIRLPDWNLFAYVFDAEMAPHIWSSALGFAAIASAESLLCATAVDQLHQGPRTHYDRELLAQGVGNMLCALVGGLPMTGVIVRSSANLDAGGKTRAAAILHGVWLLGLVCLAPWVLALVPMASLAGILVFTGYKLINFKAVRELWAVGKSEVVIAAVTFAVIVGEDLLMGVLVGVVLSALKLLYNFTRLHMRLEDDLSRCRSILHLEGAATFLRLPQLAAMLESVPRAHELHVQMDRLDYIDHACFNLLANWAKQHQAQGGRLVIDWQTLHACFRQQPVTPPWRKAS